MAAKEAKSFKIFDGGSTALQILYGKNLNGKVALITGANAGIGFETARSLALHNCEVIFGCRNQKLALEAIEKIKEEKPDAKCIFIRIDLSSLKTVKDFAEEVKKKYQHIDYLILNAALYMTKYSKTQDDLEISFQVCHLSHFYLTMEVSDLLDSDSRVVVLSSEAHRYAIVRSNELTEQFLSPTYWKFWRILQYNNNKLWNVLFARELAKRWESRGIEVFSLHPGYFVTTNIQKNWCLCQCFYALMRPFTKNVQQAAATTIFCCIAPELNNSKHLYFQNCQVERESALAQNDTLAANLWTISEKMIDKILNPPKVKEEHVTVDITS